MSGQVGVGDLREVIDDAVGIRLRKQRRARQGGGQRDDASGSGPAGRLDAGIGRIVALATTLPREQLEKAEGLYRIVTDFRDITNIHQILE